MFHLIVDSGCSLTFTPHKEDFIQMITLTEPQTLQGVGGNVEVTQCGIARYEVINTTGNVSVLETVAYYHPSLKFRLFSPQSFFAQSKEQGGTFEIGYNKATMHLKNGDHVDFLLDTQTFMPLMPAFHNTAKVAYNLSDPSVVTPENSNLSPLQKLLLKYHYKMGHLGFQHLKWLGRIGLFKVDGEYFSHPQVTPPKCTACLYGSQQRRPLAGTHTHQHNKGVLKREKLQPGDLVFSDQYVSSLPGQNFNTCGQELCHQGFHGGTIFCDAASGYMFLQNQVGFTAAETIETKLAFERDALHVGVSIHSYRTDNGVYTSKSFGESLTSNHQDITHSGVGGHHHNGPAENAIKNITRRARIMMFHAALYWPEASDCSLWPLAMQHAVFLHNNTPHTDHGLSPLEIWSQSKSTLSALANAHPWGCPVYVLQPRLQDGQKLPRWEPCS